ncbi:MAG TPA: hypothetical protein VHK91_06695 [Flavisolibacter sp.]|jgi:hypothetical protein|nr:hypothetical protein [Flavisolibacter sp.]
MSKIKTYEELLQEEQRLLADLRSKEAVIRTDLAGVKEGLKPVQNVINTVGKFTTRDKTGPLFNFGIDFSIDLLIRRILLARAGWFTKIVVPYVIKNYSSHIINEQQKAKLMKKINGFFEKLRPKTEAGAARAKANGSTVS